jgi:hypothetical protein
VGSFVSFYIKFVGCFGQQVYNPKQWVNFRSEGTSHSVPIEQSEQILDNQFTVFVDSCGWICWVDF